MTTDLRVNLGTADGCASFDIDLGLVLRGNLLLQAGSGGGKSRTLRRLAEQAFGKVPQIIIDPEGEFATLRQKYDFLLIGKEGDAPTDVRSAPLLAIKLLELGASAIIDLFEMDKDQRPAWTAAFIQALVNAPKSLWHDLLIYIDEAHELAPELGHGSRESEGEKASRRALTALGAKGRKRGFGTVAATQRLGKLSKDFAAELKSVLVGQTWMDIDRERAAGCLGIGRAERKDFDARVKTLPPGTFYALGRALCLDPVLVKVGDVRTEHPEAGRRQAAPPPPTAKIRHLLPQLADLPREAEEKVMTERELRAEIKSLRSELLVYRKAETKAKTKATTTASSVQSPSLMAMRSLEVLIRKQIEELKALYKILDDRVTEELDKQAEHLGQWRESFERNLKNTVQTRIGRVLGKLTEVSSSAAQKASPKALPEVIPRVPTRPLLNNPNTQDAGSAGDLPFGERWILTLIVQHQSQGGATREMLTVITGYKRSSRDTYLFKLQSKGFIEKQGEKFLATEQGLSLSGNVEPLPTGSALLDHLRKELPEGDRRVLDVVVSDYPSAVSVDKIDEQTGYKRSSRDTYLHHLLVRFLVERVGPGQIIASEMLFD